MAAYLLRRIGLRRPHRARRAAPAVRAVLRRDRPRRHRAQGGRREGAAGGLRAVEDEPRLRQAAVPQPRASRARDARRYTDTLLVEHFRRMLTFDFGRSDADDSPIAAPPAGRRGAEPQPHRAAVRARAARRHRAGAVRRLLPRDLHRPRRARAVHADHERRRPALHHRRAVPRRHAAQVVPDLGLRSRPDRDGALPRPAGAGRRRVAASVRTCASTAPSSSRR